MKPGQWHPCAMFKPGAILDRMEARAAACGTTLQAVAEAAGVAWSTIWRIRQGGDPMMSTMDKLEQALLAMEKGAPDADAA